MSSGSYSFTYRPYAEALYEALQEDAFYSTMERSVPANDPPREAMLRYYDFSMCEADRYGRLTLAPVKTPGAALWHLPLTTNESQRKQHDKRTFIRDWMSPASLNVYDAIVTEMSDQSADTVPSHAWYLSILGVDVRHHRQGIGSALLAPVLKEIDQTQTLSYLETFTPGNHTFYQRLGYRPSTHLHNPTTHASYCLMIRS